MDRDTLMYWIAFLSRKQRQHDKKDYQLALLTKIVAQMFAKGRGKPLDEYLIKIQTPEEKQEEALENLLDKIDNLPVFADTKVEYID